MRFRYSILCTLSSPARCQRFLLQIQIKYGRSSKTHTPAAAASCDSTAVVTGLKCRRWKKHPWPSFLRKNALLQLDLQPRRARSQKVSGCCSLRNGRCNNSQETLKMFQTRVAGAVQQGSSSHWDVSPEKTLLYQSLYLQYDPFLAVHTLAEKMKYYHLLSLWLFRALFYTAGLLSTLPRQFWILVSLKTFHTVKIKSQHLFIPGWLSKTMFRCF